MPIEQGWKGGGFHTAHSLSFSQTHTHTHSMPHRSFQVPAAQYVGCAVAARVGAGERGAGRAGHGLVEQAAELLGRPVGPRFLLDGT